MNIPYILFWTVITVLLGILYYRFICVYRLRIRLILPKAWQAFKTQLVRVVRIVGGLRLRKIRIALRQPKGESTANTKLEPGQISDGGGTFQSPPVATTDSGIFKPGFKNRWGLWIVEGLIKRLAGTREKLARTPSERIQDVAALREKESPANIQLESERLSDKDEPLKGAAVGKMNSPIFMNGFKNALKYFLEWTVIAVWSLWIGRSYLDMGLNMWPSGGQEYMMSLQNQYVWALLPKCGACFFWNGFTNGGAPSFIDTHGAWLHPIAIIATFLFGVFNSGKVIVIASLFMAGLGQWWLGKILKLGAVARLWTALILVASGALVGRMQVGSVPLVLSTAACSLAYPAVLQLALNGGKRAAIALGIILGLAALAGQGYLQIGLGISLVPILVVLLIKTKADGVLGIKTQGRYLLFALVLAGLIAAPLLIPVAHYLPILGKDTDPNFSSTQPLEYSVLNLVINNTDFYGIDALGKQTFPYLNVNYIGWIPVIFAIMGLSLAPREFRKLIIGISAATGFIYLTSSGVVLKWISSFLPDGNFITGIRNPGPIQGLAAPLILALAGIGASEIIKKEWPQLSLTISNADQKYSTLRIKLKWVVMPVLMVLALSSVADFSQVWLNVQKFEPDTNALIQPLKTAGAQWVEPPFGDYVWLPASIENGLKIREFFRPWRITDASLPGAYLEMSNIKDDINLPEYLGSSNDYVILKRPDNLYASITNEQGVSACQASSIGGIVDVACDSRAAGQLIVLENALSGWTVWRDGKQISLSSGHWLTVDAPEGKHRYAFRYQPWDAPLGIGLAALGWLAAIIGFFYHSRNGRQQPRQMGSAR